LEEHIYLYDLTSTYFEGLALANPKAQRGYSRDKRPDCKQVVVGLVLDGEGFPKAHEVFAGNRVDTTTVEEMLHALETRTGRNAGSTVGVDRGMAHAKNLALIRTRGYHYLVAGLQPEREEYLDQIGAEEAWQEVIRKPSPRNEGQKKSQVLVKLARVVSAAPTTGESKAEAAAPPEPEQVVLCWSEGRTKKDRAIRLKQDERCKMNDGWRIWSGFHGGA
jgi:hypothetical protein